MEKTKVTLSAVCLFGLESLLGEEIKAMGFTNTETMDGRVFFEASVEDIPRVNINLRFAERVLILMGKFPATTFTELFDGTNALPWEEWMPKDAEFPVKGHAIKSTLFSVPDCQKIVKKAIATRLGSKYGMNILPEDGAKYQVEFFIFKDTAHLMIDTSGAGLHKRGYRPVANDAPLRETLAAALVKISRPRENVLLWDPMCGSGTIPIEAAMIGANIAPGMNREFLAQTWNNIPKKMWPAAVEEAKAKIRTDVELNIQGYDLDGEMVNISRENAKLAGVDKLIHFQRRSVEQLSHPKKYGFLITNPPYGERLSDKKEMPALYRIIGERYRNLDSWSMYLITAYEQAEQDIGRKADKNRKIYNGMMKTYYYQFLGPKPPKRKDSYGES